MPDPNPIIFLIDDDEAIRKSLTRALSKRNFEVKAFETADEFLSVYDNSQLGCLLLDYGMPGMNGLELQKLLIKKGFFIPVIFITGHGGVPESVEAMKTGAIDFLEKPFRQVELVKCINIALEHALILQKNLKKKHKLQEIISSLTSREMEIAQFMISNPSNTSSKYIGRQLDISHRTVDHHRARLLEKMALSSVAELIDLSKITGLFLTEKTSGISE